MRPVNRSGRAHTARDNTGMPRTTMLISGVLLSATTVAVLARCHSTHRPERPLTDDVDLALDAD